jgi:hypothetical protein
MRASCANYVIMRKYARLFGVGNLAEGTGRALDPILKAARSPILYGLLCWVAGDCTERRSSIYGTAQRRLLTDLLGAVGEDVEIEPPFHCGYGTQLVIGTDVYINVGCVVLDCAQVMIGDRALFGPGVHIYTAGHFALPIPALIAGADGARPLPRQAATLALAAFGLA